MQFRCKGEEANEGRGRGVREGGVGAHLILVELAVLVGGLSLVLEGDDDETDEDVDHEEGEDDDVDDVEDGHVRTVVVHGTHVLGVRVDGHVQDAKEDVKDVVIEDVKEDVTTETNNSSEASMTEPTSTENMATNNGTAIIIATDLSSTTSKWVLVS